MQKLDANGLGLEDGLQVIRVDAILCDEAFEDMETLGGQLVDTSIFEEIR